MKKQILTLLSILLIFGLCACEGKEPSIVGCWNTETPLFQTEEAAEEIIVIFYEGMEAEEKHIKNGNTYKTYQFDYVLDGEVLTIYTGATETAYAVRLSKHNSTDTMMLTSPDKAVHSYILRTQTTPGIH